MFEIQHLTPRPAIWWYGERDYLDMDPTYQRRGQVWSLADRQLLIDSIINDYDIPKLYVADFTKLRSSINEERKKYSVIDGKQRLEALFGFFSNEFPLSESFVYNMNPTQQLGGLYYKDLKTKFPYEASKVDVFPLSVVHVVTDEIDQINILFTRLNRSKPLTGAEKRNAMVGPVPKLIRQISEHEFFSRCVRFNGQRGQKRDVAAKFILFEDRGKPADTKKVHLDKLVEKYSGASIDDISDLRVRVESVLQKLSCTFGMDDDLLRSQGPLSVYYWFIRNMTPDNLVHARAFLSTFEARVEENKVLMKAGGDVDSSLSEYALLSRSLNDQRAIDRRVKILEHSFDDYMANIAFS